MPAWRHQNTDGAGALPPGEITYVCSTYGDGLSFAVVFKLKYDRTCIAKNKAAPVTSASQKSAISEKDIFVTSAKTRIKRPRISAGKLLKAFIDAFLL
jgi:hypothetical protein